jgi:hypothetical protein
VVVDGGVGSVGRSCGGAAVAAVVVAGWVATNKLVLLMNYVRQMLLLHIWREIDELIY